MTRTPLAHPGVLTAHSARRLRGQTSSAFDTRSFRLVACLAALVTPAT
jgi:hypothetical protein